jgi:hypothetical protein
MPGRGLIGCGVVMLMMMWCGVPCQVFRDEFYASLAESESRIRAVIIDAQGIVEVRDDDMMMMVMLLLLIMVVVMMTVTDMTTTMMTAAEGGCRLS